MERINIKSKDSYKVVSLFSGIGGLDLGFEFAGFNLVWANDFDKYAVETYKKNVSSSIEFGDIRTLKDKIPNHDVLIGGFPCQPFSTLGSLDGFEDKERGNLFFDIKDILVKHKTKVVVLENVKNLINHDKKNTFKTIVKELESAGYVCYWDILNSQNFGVPQRRNRVFIVGFLKNQFKKASFEFPKGEELTVTTQDLLDKEVDKKYFLSKKILKTILGKGTKNFVSNPTIDQKISKTLTATMHKMHRASQDNYFTDIKNRELFIDDQKSAIRRLTPDECRKLQGFPSDWVQVVSDTQAYRQFGNAVTVNVSYAIACKIGEYISNNKLE